MKKLFSILILATLTVAIMDAQGLFKPVQSDLFKVQDKALSLREGTITQAWVWRFDASIAIVELNYNKVDKQLVSTAFSAVGPAIGYQHFVPTSVTDPTPFNNYGFSAAVLLGESIYNPQVASLKVAVVANIMQYLKFGGTYTLNPQTNFSHFGLFFGGGITF